MRKILVLFSFLISFSMLNASEYDIINLTSNDGLSNSSINTIYQTSNGLMWFGTWDGLNMYNGKDVRIFKPELYNNKSISNNIIRNIIEEDENNYWIATDLGINCLNIRTKAFKRYFSDTYNQNFSENSFLIAKNNNGQIFATILKKGLFFFNKEKQQFFPLNINNDLSYKKIFFDLDNNLWCYTSDKKLYKIVFKKNNSSIPKIENIIEFVHLKKIESVFYPSEDEIWIQTSDKQLFSYHISAGLLSQINLPYKVGLLKTIIQKDDYLLLATENGLYKYFPKTSSLNLILANNSILSVYVGTQGIIWVGTDAQGVWQISPSKAKFETYSSENIVGFGKNAVRTFLVDNNKLWVGTKGDGIYVLEKNKEKQLKITKHFNVSSGLLNNSVFNLAKGVNNEVWIGTDGKGINYFDNKKNRLFQLQISDSLQKKINITSVYSILPSGENTLWIGTSGYGMYKIELDLRTQPYSIKRVKQYKFNEKIKKSLSNNIVYAIIKDDNKHLWIATRGGGLNRFDIEKETFQAFRHNPNNTKTISNDDVLSLHKDKNGFLWIGTSIGLNKLIDFKNGNAVFIHFSEKEGMPNNTIHGILDDNKKNIWVSTNNGIVKLVPENNIFRIVSYNKKDGLQSNEFSDGASYADLNSNFFYFGGINGFNAFNPQKISQNYYMPPLWLDAFFVDNKEENLSDYTKNNKLVLSYKNKSFSFKFLPLDYLSGSKCEIAYQLEGYQKDWIQLGTSNLIVLSNLPKGNYKLKVRYTNADKIKNVEYFILPIKMTTPWWKNTYSQIAYFLLLSLLIWWIWQIKQNQLQAKNSVKIKELESKKTEEIHEAKLRFFTNIAHEFSNSITLIYVPCEQLLRSPESTVGVKKYVNTIKSNSERMQKLIHQLIEFRKAETGHLQTYIEKIDVPELIKYVLDNFLDVLEQNKINYHLSFSPENIIWQTDRDSLEKVVFNLISNAVKYTPINENINIELTEKEHILELKVTNTGIGIDSEFQESIFDRFEVLNRFEKQVSKGIETRNGIGLALCKNIVELLDGNINLESDGKTYTTFFVSLPYKKLSKQKEEISQEREEKTFSVANDALLLGEEESNFTENEALDNSSIITTDKKRVLIIEDEKEIRELIKEFLSKKYAVTEASNGAEAINIMRQQMPNVVVCDVMMPVMNGTEFVRIMKSQELTKYIPIILLSSKSSVESQILGLELGADAYLGKPFHPRHLEVLIFNLLNKDKTLRDYGDSPYAALEQYEGKMIHKEDKKLIQNITKIIYENIENENLSIDFIASETAISKMQLYRKVKEILEQTPTEYIRSIRLQQASKLLKTTNKTVAEIMYGCGFNNKAYFYREFLKTYKLSPKEYRLSKIENKEE